MAGPRHLGACIHRLSCLSFFLISIPTIWERISNIRRANCSPHEYDHVEPLHEAPEEDEFDNEHPTQEEEHDALIMLLRETAGRNPAARREDPDALGERTEDWQYDWSFHVNTYRDRSIPSQTEDLALRQNSEVMPDIHVSTHWWARAKELSPVTSRVDFQSQSMADRLAPEQRLIYDLVIHHYDSQSRQPLLINIDGRAGTGKSFIIQVLSAHLQVHTSDEVILRCAPTGAASFGIRGSTLHSLLKLPVNKPLEPLRPAAAQALQLRVAQLKYLIIDEKSMVSLKTLHYIDLRFQQAFATQQRFGGISILLFGDFWQLPPVRDKAIYFNPHAIPSHREVAPIETELIEGIPAPRNRAPVLHDIMKDQDWHGYHAYHAFQQSIELTVQQRQDPSQVDFADACNEHAKCPPAEHC